MVTKIRLARFGRKKSAFYRIVAADVRSPRDGGFIEILGHYNPMINNRAEGTTKKEKFVVKNARLAHWLSVGAQPTDVIKKYIVRSGDFEGFSEKYSKELEVRAQASKIGQEKQAAVKAAASAKAE